MSAEYQLRLTHRALDDLDLPYELAQLPADAYVDEHDCVRAFVERRSQNPEGQEATYPPVTRAITYNLHCERHRGLTWHDEAHGVVWLLGVGWHEESSRDDAYRMLKSRDEDGVLFPLVEDYRALVPNAKEFVYDLHSKADDLLDEAVETGSSQTAVIGDVLEVTVDVEVVDVEGVRVREVRLDVAMPPRVQGVLPDNWTPTVLAAFFPDAGLNEIESAAGSGGFRFKWIDWAA